MFSVAVDITGQRFGRLVVVRRVENLVSKTGRRLAQWECRCDCGATHKAAGSKLRYGWTKSCGCWSRDRTSEVATKHGAVGTPEYDAWRSMKRRCASKSARNAPWYRDRGITVCERWKNDFTAFLADVGPRPAPGYSIDRIDNDRGYEPGNVRWATSREQRLNQRRMAK